MSSGSVFEFSGHIELVAEMRSGLPTNEDEASRRRSRLNDVMIVLEHDLDTLERRLAQILGDALAPAKLHKLRIALNSDAPKLQVTAEVATASRKAVRLSRSAQDTLEGAIAQTITSAILERVRTGEVRRWTPRVTVETKRQARASSRANASRSIWLKTLMWLLAAVILATVYMMLRPI